MCVVRGAGLHFDRTVKNISSDGSTWEAGSLDYWREEALKRFGGKVQDSAHGVEMIKPPISDALYDPDNPTVSSHLMIEKGTNSDTLEMKEAKLYYEAGLIIENNQGMIEGKDGNMKKVNLAPCNAVSTKTFYDAREGKTMTTTEVDIGKLTDCGKMPDNGVLYVSHSGSNAGVRLVNGEKLPSQGLTVVSENPVYIQGDYNTVNKVPAAVLGDAITVLSNAWNDDNSNKNLGDRKATETTVNAALAMGPHAEAKPGAGNGEFNNLIRFLEDWNNVKYNYRGSVVALWHSQQATAPWSCCGYYRPPIRDWGYDTLFDTNPPPGTPMGMVHMRGQWSSGS